MITTVKRKVGNLCDYVNELTRTCDTYLLDHERSGLHNTYLMQSSSDKYCFLIRYPGATRGYIIVDSNNCIVDIRIYQEPKEIVCYESHLEKTLIKKFLAEQITIKEDVWVTKYT